MSNYEPDTFWIWTTGLNVATLIALDYDEKDLILLSLPTHAFSREER